MSSNVYGMAFGAVCVVTIGPVIAWNVVSRNRARRSFAAGNAQRTVGVAAMRRIARNQTRHLRAVVLVAALTMTLTMNSTIDDVPALFVLPVLLGVVAVAVGPLRRRAIFGQRVTLEEYRGVSDGRRLFLVRDETLVTWFTASPAALADAGILPSARVE